MGILLRMTMMMLISLAGSKDKNLLIIIIAWLMGCCGGHIQRAAIAMAENSFKVNASVWP